MSVRVRITKGKYEDSYNAVIVKSNESGTIDKQYISKEKQKEVAEHGYAYVNQRHERVV